MPKHTVERDGERDLRFEGKLLAGASDREHSGPRNTRWTEIKIYKTAGGQYVVAIVGRTLWQDEFDTHDAIVCKTAGDVLAALSGDHGYLSLGAKNALREAAEADGGFRKLEYEDI